VASPARTVERQIAAGRMAGEVSEMDETLLLVAYRLCWRLQAASRLLTDQVVDPDALGEGARAFLLRETDMPDAATLSVRLTDTTAAADRVIVARLGG